MKLSNASTRPSKFSMKVKFVLPIIIFALLFGSVMPHIEAAVVTSEIQRKIEQAKKEKELLLEEERRLKAELERVSSQSKSLASTVMSLNSTKQKLNNDIKLTGTKINSTNLNIEMLEYSVEDKTRMIQTHKQAIAYALQEIANSSSRSLVLDMLAYEKISDVWHDRARLEDLSGRLNSEISDLRKTKAELDKEKEEKEKSKLQLVSLKNQLGGQKQVVEESQNAQARLLAETKNKEAEYQKMLADNIARQREFEADLFKFESELRLNLDPSLVPSAKPGVLSWPLDNVYVTQRFGKTSASGRLYASGTHNGIDFRAPMGTPVKSVLSGVVEGTGNTDDQRGCYSYGRWILIKHPNGLTSIYAHLSGSAVKAGQTVKAGEVIGYSGGTPGVSGSGYSTGPHLHLGLFASQGVSIQQFTSSKGCKQVYVPIADAQAYLDPLAYLPAAN
jgi:murein DD-endopeptidase MepM/ murein hydrolase activator NlpD